jgi:hypothetical protein
MERTAKILAVVGFLVLCGSAWAIDGNEPIAHWKFDESAGGTAYDSVGDNDGTVHGAVWSTGQIDGALSFDGINDYVDVGDPRDGSLDFGTADFTLSVWFKTSMSAPGLFVCKRAKGYYAGYDFYIERDGRIFARIADGSSVPGASTTERFNDGLWHHAAAVYDRDGVIRIYVDSVSKATSRSIKWIGNVNNSEPFTIGDRNDPGHHYYFDGSIDDVRIYNRALSAEEIWQLYQAAPVACILGGDRTVEAGSGCEAKITLDGSCSSDADSTPGTNDDINDFDWYDVVDVCDPNSDIFLGSGEIIECNLPLGEHTIILEVIDKADAFDANEVTITVEDTTPPEFSLSVTPDVLWPANHKMVEITPSWEVSDNCDELPEVTLVGITMNEDGATEDDIQVKGDGSIYLRAERSGRDSGRVYTITYRAVDDSGNVAVESATVTVPHDRRRSK